jgi:hypothetical protein
VKGSVALEKHIFRSENKVGWADEAGTQFTELKIPDNSTKSRHVPSFEMMKQKGRNDIFLTGKDLPDYDPNYEIGKRKIGQTVTKFHTVTARKPVERPMSTYNEKFYDYDSYKNSNSSYILKR